ncbi:RNA methyltransferase [Candidatus Liberibacter africanus]|uniref:tRNA/rRNA methyltransferase protein n=1 Tax=Candidatus Liberibacter africanus PTSAPSY TaxID=1277257 RepID=A0A0G3I342_LIBAF|nr:RNA methyltransferase [Candidatus Liberibacter africanus]AKK20304.1 tRNA/rRNA methyltransferase protein [Candidatus Liberibacter africanus PTSAPSY]QTP64058.1 RNA methyltransferase [Candidatus Liberibacter africanus]
MHLISKKNFAKTFSPKDSHYAKLRRNYRDRKKMHSSNKKDQHTSQKDTLFLYGIHTVSAAINNPKREIFQLLATENALARLDWDKSLSHSFPIKTVLPKTIDQFVGKEAAHQGVALETAYLPSPTLDTIQNNQLIIILDHVKDPHNVGAILRSSVAFGCSAVITTKLHSPPESAVLAKSASGAFEHIPYIRIGNITDALQKIHSWGFQTIGLSSNSPQPLEQEIKNEKIALILGSEGKGLRQKTQETVNSMAHLHMPGTIKSLNVSNAAAVSLYITQKYLSQ